jgi:phosphomannomutase
MALQSFRKQFIPVSFGLGGNSITKIMFGTDGWRALMSKEFKLSKVKVVAQAIADYMKDHGLEEGGIIVGYDTRKWSRRFAEEVCRVMLGNRNGITSQDLWRING